MRAEAARDEKVTADINGYFLDQIAHRLKLAEALRHDHRLAVFKQIHLLRDNNFERLAGVFAETESLERSRQAGDVAMMVGAPDVDDGLKSAGDLVGLLGDTGQQVGRPAIRTHDDAVFIVAIFGADE